MLVSLLNGEWLATVWSIAFPVHSQKCVFPSHWWKCSGRWCSGSIRYPLCYAESSFTNGAVGGRYADFHQTENSIPEEKIENLDFFHEMDAPGLKGLGFNSPMAVRAIDLDGDEQTELFVTIGGTNSSQNLVKHLPTV